MIRSLGTSVLAIIVLKILVLFGVFSSTDLNKPLSVDINLESQTVNAKINKLDNDLHTYKFKNGKPIIGNKLVKDGDIIEINGDEYLVDVKIDTVVLEEYKFFQKVKVNFIKLNQFPLFSWTFYIRTGLMLIMLIFILGVKDGILTSIPVITIFTFLTFLIVNTLGWTGYGGYSVYLLIIIIDAIIGAVNGASEEY